MSCTLTVIQINIYPFDNLNMVNAKKLKKNYCLFKQLNSCSDICLIYYLYNDNHISGKKDVH